MVKHLIWGDLIMYAKVAWERVVKFIVSSYSTEALLKGFTQTWGARNVLCRTEVENHFELEVTTFLGS